MIRLVALGLILAGCASWPDVNALTRGVPTAPVRLLADATATGCEWNATQMRWHYPPDAQGNPVLALCTILRTVRGRPPRMAVAGSGGVRHDGASRVAVVSDGTVGDALDGDPSGRSPRG